VPRQGGLRWNERIIHLVCPTIQPTRCNTASFVKNVSEHRLRKVWLR
jgi:hypothetical protein